MKTTVVKINIETACPECDLTIEKAVAEENQKIKCPRCKCCISNIVKSPDSSLFAYSLSALIMMAASLSYSFLSFSSSGQKVEMNFIQTIDSLILYGYYGLASLLVLTLFVLPLLYLLGIVYLSGSLILNKKPCFAKEILNLLKYAKNWLMVDVFLIGVLVSLVKIMSMAEVGFGLSFWAFVLFSIFLVKTVSISNFLWLWTKFDTGLKKIEVKKGSTAKQNNFILCENCGKLNLNSKQECTRCGFKIRLRSDPQLEKVMAYLITAIMLYIPANALPIMSTSILGQEEPSTILGGVFLLWEIKSYFVSIVVFIASIVIPLTKIFSIGWLIYSVKRGRLMRPAQKMKLYRITEYIGKWSMIDVFVVAILVALIQVEGLIAIYPGGAVTAFSLVVILTMLSANSFDPRLLWDKKEHKGN